MSPELGGVALYEIDASGLQSESTHGSEGQTALELLPRAHHLLRELLHRHLPGEALKQTA